MGKQEQAYELRTNERLTRGEKSGSRRCKGKSNEHIEHIIRNKDDIYYNLDTLNVVYIVQSNI